MKTGFWDRVLVYLYVLITLIVIAAVALRAFGLDLVGCMIEGLRVNAPGLIWRIILIGVSALVAVLGVYVGVVITPSRGKKSNFISLSSDNGGQVRIALPAIRQMASQAIAGIEGLQDVAISIGEESDAVVVNVSMNVENGVHVPTVTMNMQSAIRRNIEHNCGVNVRSVTVTVKDVLPGSEPVFAAEAVKVVPAEEKKAEKIQETAEIDMAEEEDVFEAAGEQIECAQENEEEAEDDIEAEAEEDEIVLTLDVPASEDAEESA